MANLFNKDIIQVRFGNSDVSQIVLGGEVLWNSDDFIVYTPYEFRGSDAEEITTYVTRNANDDLSYMFDGCWKLQKVNSKVWDTRAVTTMQNMFSGCVALPRLNLYKFNTGSVTTMQDMFSGCISLYSLDLSNFNTINVRTMQGMFNGCESLQSLNLSSFNTRSVASMADMFNGCSHLVNLDLSNFFVYGLSNINGMFFGCLMLKELDLSSWNLYYIKDNVDMLANCPSLIKLKMYGCNESTINKVINSSGFPTNEVPNETRFIYCDKELINQVELPDNWEFYYIPWEYIPEEYRGNEKLSIAKTIVNESHTDLSHMFDGCIKLKRANTEDWNTAEVTTTSYMFRNCELLASVGDISNWKTHNLTTTERMFNGCSNLTELDLSNWDVKNVTRINSMFANCTKLKTVNLSNWTFTSSANMIYGGMFSNCAIETIRLDNCNNVTIKRIIGGINGSTLGQSDKDVRTIYCQSVNARDKTATGFLELPAGWTFDFLGELPPYKYVDYEFMNNKEIVSAHPLVDTSHTSLYRMFYNCKKLTSVNLSSCDTSNVLYMEEMFYGCDLLEKVDLSSFNTSKVVTMDHMFAGCDSITSIDVSSFDTSQVKKMNSMFYECYLLPTVDVSGFDVSNVTDMSYMFYRCYNLETLDLSNWDVSHVPNMNSMFAFCNKLTNFKAPKNISYGINFGDCTKLTHESLMSIINNLATVTETRTLSLSGTSMNMLSDEEKAIATNKNWILR